MNGRCCSQSLQCRSSVSFSSAMNFFRQSSSVTGFSSSTDSATAAPVLMISLDFALKSFSIICECHSIAMWHFFKNWWTTLSEGSMTQPEHFLTHGQVAQFRPWRFTCFRRNGFTPFSIDIDSSCSFQFAFAHQWFSLCKNFESVSNTLCAWAQISS